MIDYLKGDATKPVGDGNKVIAHVCNDIGKWGRGFVLAISKRWKQPEQVYKDAFKTGVKPVLGDVQFVKVSPTITVANMIAQHGVRSPKNTKAPPPIRYEAVEACLTKLAQYAIENSTSVHMPRIGCGLAGGTWEEIEPRINSAFSNQDISVNIYDF